MGASHEHSSQGPSDSKRFCKERISSKSSSSDVGGPDSSETCDPHPPTSLLLENSQESYVPLTNTSLVIFVLENPFFHATHSQKTSEAVKTVPTHPTGSSLQNSWGSHGRVSQPLDRGNSQTILSRAFFPFLPDAGHRGGLLETRTFQSFLPHRLRFQRIRLCPQ